MSWACFAVPSYQRSSRSLSEQVLNRCLLVEDLPQVVRGTSSKELHTVGAGVKAEVRAEGRVTVNTKVRAQVSAQVSAKVGS